MTPFRVLAKEVGYIFVITAYRIKLSAVFLANRSEIVVFVRAFRYAYTDYRQRDFRILIIAFHHTVYRAGFALRYLTVGNYYDVSSVYARVGKKG